KTLTQRPARRHRRGVHAPLPEAVSCRRTHRASPPLSWRRLHHDQVVTMNHLVARLVAEEPLDVARVCALDPVQLRSWVAHQAARHLGAVRTEAAHAVTDAEGSLDGADPRRQQAAAALGQRALRAGVEVEGADGSERVRDPVLTTGEWVSVAQQ